MCPNLWHVVYRKYHNGETGGNMKNNNLSLFSIQNWTYLKVNLFFSWVSKRFLHFFIFVCVFDSQKLSWHVSWCCGVANSRSSGCKQVIFGTITLYCRYLTSAELEKFEKYLISWCNTQIQYLTQKKKRYSSFSFFMFKWVHFHLTSQTVCTGTGNHMLPHIWSLHSGATKHDCWKGVKRESRIWIQAADGAVIINQHFLLAEHMCNSKSIHFHTPKDRKNKYSLARETQSIG